MSQTDGTSREIGYQVIDIATPVALLTCWEAEQAREDIVRCACENNLTYIPVRDSKRITGIVSRRALEAGEAPSSLTSDWLITTDTTILEVIELFAEQPDRVFLVLQSSRIVGLVAPADLNKIPARASVYLLVAHFEAELMRLIKRVLPDEADYRACFTDNRWKKLHQLRTEFASKDFELDLLHCLYASDMERIVSKADRLRDALGYANEKSAERALEGFQDIRNRVSHPTRPLVASRGELVKLNETCRRLIDLNQRIARANGTT
ncbi:MAG: hypothetical protein K8J31_15625 [Anaerolineae bacterium]|nr:hypothetical protein [Anaerolineae bacterium]